MTARAAPGERQHEARDHEGVHENSPMPNERMQPVKHSAVLARSNGACGLGITVSAEHIADPNLLPAEHQAPAPASAMGGAIGQWLAFRAADRSLSLFSLVVPSGAMTPVHDHLAWGLVGVYRGNQDEEFYEPTGEGLVCTRRRPLSPGDFYALLPPRNDIHRVRTTSTVTSVSIQA